MKLLAGHSRSGGVPSRSVGADRRPLDVARRTSLTFAVHDPWKDRLVKTFAVVHEKLFHAFIVSEDLEFFEHGHPTPIGNGTFEYVTRLPAPGMFRILGDFYPEGATPQLITETVFVPGAGSDPPRLGRDYSEKNAANMRVSLQTIPEQPVAGQRTQMRFTLDTGRPGKVPRRLGAHARLQAMT